MSGSVDERQRPDEKQRRTFDRLYALVIPIVKLLYPMKSSGRENIPEGPALVCANHSNMVDPFLVAAAFGRKNFMHFMAKLELSAVPVVGAVLKSCGVYFVDRGRQDIDAIRNTMRFLKRGEKVCMFPEGTRTSEDNSVEAKTGAVRIASRMKVPIVPVYIPRRKKVFARTEVLIGEPFLVEGKTHEDYVELADGVMERIYELRDGTAG